jgi:hypothetical protein
MRSMLVLSICFHLVFFLISLARLGFLPMLEDLIMAAIAFSCYLTLYIQSIRIYMTTIMLSLVVGAFEALKY